MGFTTSCFVRVEDAEKREKLIECIENIGYIFLMRDSESNVLYTDVTSGCLLCAFESSITQSEMISRGFIDCGANTDLFLALAAMRDDTDYMQWFTDGKGWYLNDIENPLYLFAMLDGGFRNATAEEIVEHFKNLKK